MLIPIEMLKNKHLPPSDICIVGAGAAGLELAYSLRNTGLKVYLLEAGFLEFDWKTQNLQRFVQEGKKWRSPENKININKPYTFLDVKNNICHLRQYGGTMNAWGGVWKPLEAVDFEDKPFYELPSWPIAYSEISSYYKEIVDDYSLGELMVKREENQLKMFGHSSDCKSLVSNIGIKDPLSGKMGLKYLDSLKQSDNIYLILGANATSLNFSENGELVKSAEIQSIEKLKSTIQAKTFVLAAGTLDNTRLLLLAQKKNNILSTNQLTGKNFLTHPKGSQTLFSPAEGPKPLERYFVDNNTVYQLSISISAENLRNWDLPNHTLILDKAEVYDREGDRTNKDVFITTFYLEQLPNRTSKITLTDELNELGLPIPKFEHCYTDNDAELFSKFFDKVKNLFIDHNVGTIGEPLKNTNLESYKLSSHLLGTTRMSATSSDGVVNSDCKVFGIENLFVAGGSVFPTIGNANPTLTILALTRRLANRLRKMNH